MPVRAASVARFALALAMLAFLGLATPIAPGSASALAADQATPSPAPTPRGQQPGDVPGFRLPFASGLEISIEQGWHSAYSHTGEAAYAYDFGVPDGTPVLAAASGVVSHVHRGETKCGGEELLHDANFVTIDHPDGSATQYGHLSKVEVTIGDVVAAGQEIGLSGRTGFTDCQPHLHFARQRQAPGIAGGVTQSVPVYFIGYDRQLLDGELITVPLVCGAPDEDAPSDAFCGAYYAPDFQGPALFTRIDPTLDFDWTAAPPGGYWLDDPADGFAARWTGRVTIDSAGLYAFRLQVSPGARVTIDGRTVIDQWFAPGAPVVLSAVVHLTAGAHDVVVEQHLFGAQGSLQLSWRLFQGDGRKHRL